MTARIGWLGALVALGLCGCSSSSGSTAIVIHPTLVAVSPADFLGRVPCASSAGGMQFYTATLWDVTGDLGSDAEPIGEFALPSSAPVPCDRTVGFNFVVPGHRYVADVEGFDRDDLVSLGPGSPVVVDAQTGERIQPRWKTSCGRDEVSSVADAGPDLDGASDGSTDGAGSSDASTDGADASDARDPNALDGPVMAVQFFTRHVRGCRPLVDHGRPGDTALSVGLGSALGGLSCGDEPGSVARFVAELGNASREAACGESVVFEALQPETFYELEVDAFEAGATTPRWGTLCRRTAQAGVTVDAVCDPLSETGALAIDLPSLLTTLSLSCDKLAEITFTLAADPPRVQTRRAPNCTAPVQLSELEPAVHEVAVTTKVNGDGGATAGPTALCEAIVEAGRTALSSCSPL